MKKHFLLFAVAAMVLITGCKKKEIPDPVNNTSTPTIFYYKATIDATPVYLEEDKNGYANGSNRVQGGINFNEDYQSSFMSTVDTEKNYYAVGVVKSYPQEPNCDQAKASITKGSYPYVENDSDGAIVEHLDEEGDIWTSALGDQTNSSFEVVELIDNNVDNYGIKIVKVKFNCILYDIYGNSKEVKDGEMYGRIINCL